MTTPYWKISASAGRTRRTRKSLPRPELANCDEFAEKLPDKVEQPYRGKRLRAVRRRAAAHIHRPGFSQKRTDYPAGRGHRFARRGKRDADPDGAVPADYRIRQYWSSPTVCAPCRARTKSWFWTAASSQNRVHPTRLCVRTASMRTWCACRLTAGTGPCRKPSPGCTNKAPRAKGRRDANFGGGTTRSRPSLFSEENAQNRPSRSWKTWRIQGFRPPSPHLCGWRRAHGAY